MAGEACNWILEHRRRLQVALGNAKERMRAAAEQRKERADRHAEWEVLPVGQAVYLRDHSHRGRAKIQDAWAPEMFKVVRAPEPGGVVYAVAPQARAAEVRHVHRSMLKPVLLNKSPPAASRPASRAQSPNSDDDGLWVGLVQAWLPEKVEADCCVTSSCHVLHENFHQNRSADSTHPQVQEVWQKGHQALQISSMKKLGMKKTWTLLLFLTFVSGSVERNVPVKNDTVVVTEQQEPDQVDVKNPPAAGVRKREDPATFLFHCVMVGFIITVSVFFICVALIKPFCAPKDEAKKPLPKDCPVVQKHPWIKGSEGAILVKCQEEV
ncbi:hypothetical protein WMY93_014678 [Mugilogobius chulae]|uniref:Uncharacterized protein n=1 Tax=Mugilogobius chulae TaxID=88201 RepID=A0AAW0NXK3_9GOBI